MRLLLMIPSLGPGGAERVMTLLAGGLAARDHEVWLVTLAGAGGEFFAIDPRVRRLGLNLMGDSRTVLHAMRANVRRFRALRRAVTGIAPDAVLSFMTSMNVLAALACQGLRVRLVVSERVDPGSHRGERWWALLRSFAYHRADAVVVQTDTAAGWFRRQLGRHRGVTVIPNPVDPAEDGEACSVAVPRPFMLAAGRLVHQKGFDILIRAFASVAAECDALQLAIAGEGPEEQALRCLATQLKVVDRVHFLGQVRGLRTLMRQAAAFILSSRYEGFPNVVLEALVSGLPVIATDCPGGPRQILGDGECGVLVRCEDPMALGNALRRVATDPVLRKRLSELGARAAEPYWVDRVVGAWEAVLAASPTDPQSA
jgi:GalNAc-alpha-(1->4)-GalNAc-alpha-(1->3)-diNAcBac-PP-undecaprenol alpha-1,4-N-acetyl-D-galactosaminyltransferase